MKVSDLNERPRWLQGDDPEIYAVSEAFGGGVTVTRVNLIRCTRTQIVTTSGYGGSRERRWRRDDFNEVGNTSYGGPRLAPAHDSKVRKGLDRAAVSVAMTDLRAYLEDIRKGARVYVDDPAAAAELCGRLVQLAGDAHKRIAPLLPVEERS